MEDAKELAYQPCSWTGSIDQYDDHVCVGDHTMRAACIGVHHAEHLADYDFYRQFTGWLAW
jgi:hypothetical protein